MNDKPENPSAFPALAPTDAVIKSPIQGMTLRDYFAAKAPEMPGWFCVHPRNPCSETEYNQFLAVATRWKYSYADAMLEARMS